MLYTSPNPSKRSSLKRFGAPLFWSVTAHAALFWALGTSMRGAPSSPAPALSVDLQHITAQKSITPNSPQTPIAKQSLVDKTNPYSPKKDIPIVTQANTPSPAANIVEISEPNVISATTINHNAVETISMTNTTAAQSITNTPSSTIESPIFDAAFLKNPQPTYPVFAKKRLQEGIVMLKVKVSTEGKAEEVELAKSSGFRLLDDAAQQAVAKWQFVPARQGDLVVMASVIVPIRFALR